MKSTYVVVTPVRDEEAFLERTVESLIRQTHRPEEFVIVDDGSKDATGEIADFYASRHSWIRTVHRQDRGFRKTGAGIIEAFYAGFRELRCTAWDYLAKLDGDLSFEPMYFGTCLERLDSDPQLGIAGGMLYYIENGQRVLEDAPRFHVRGGAKIYRRECWNSIGGIWPGPSNDTIDEVKANMLGWRSLSFDDLLLEHHRPTGKAYGRWGALTKNGNGDYVCGYHPLFMMAKCAKRSVRPPYIIGAAGLMWGYVKAYLTHCPRVDEPEMICYLRRQQLRRLAGLSSIWR